MISCILEKSSLFGRDLEQFEEIQNHFGWSEGVTRTKIGTWQTIHNSSEFPTIEEMSFYEADIADIKNKISKLPFFKDYKKLKDLLNELKQLGYIDDDFISEIYAPKKIQRNTVRQKLTELSDKYGFRLWIEDATKQHEYFPEVYGLKGLLINGVTPEELYKIYETKYQQLWSEYNRSANISDYYKNLTSDDIISEQALAEQNFHENRISYEGINVLSFKNKRCLVLSDKDSKAFDSYLIESRGKLPKEFVLLDSELTLVKSNNRSNSKLYNIINKYGEVLYEKYPVYTKEEYEAIKEKRKETIQGPNGLYLDKLPSIRHSLAFRKFITSPSKGLFKKSAKDFLRNYIKANYEAEKVPINIDFIDRFVDQFPDSFWNSVITNTLALNRLYSKSHSGRLGLTTRGTATSYALEEYTMPLTISKRRLLTLIEKELNKEGKSIYGKFSFEGPINENMPYNDLKKSLVQQYEYFYGRYESTEERIARYAADHEMSVKAVKEHIKQLKETEDMLGINEAYAIENYSRMSSMIQSFEKEYDAEFREYIREVSPLTPEEYIDRFSRGIHIFFTKDSPFATIGDALTTILHEPWHALEMFHGTDLYHADVLDKWEDFIKTKLGDKYYSDYKTMLLRIDPNLTDKDIRDEFLADLFSVMCLPKDLRTQIEDNSRPGLILRMIIDCETSQDKAVKSFWESLLKNVQELMKKFFDSMEKIFDFIIEKGLINENSLIAKETGYDANLKLQDLFASMDAMMRSDRSFTKMSDVTVQSHSAENRISSPQYEFYSEQQMKQVWKYTNKAQNNVINIYTLEMQQIKDQAIANGTFMKAPNGKPTNLNEWQWLVVRTKAFKEWFGDWEKYAPTSDSSKVEEQLALVFERIPELSKIGSIREYAAYLADKFPNSVDRSIYWHGTNEDFSDGFKSAKKGKGSGAPETQSRNDFYLAKQAWTVLQYVNGVNRNSVDKNGFAHWNKLWWELKEIMSNGRRENNNWKDMVIGEDTVRQGIPNKKGVFNRDKGGGNGKWLSERKADYGYENKSDKEFFEDILGIQWGKDTFNTWTKRNAEAFKALEKTQKGIYPAIINTQNPIREKGQNTYYEEQRGLFTQAEREGNDAILGEHTDNEFGSDVAIVLNASEKNVHFLGTKEDIEGFKKWLEENRASKVVDENGEPLVVYHGGAKGINVFKAGGSNTGEGYYENTKTGEKIEADSANTMFFSNNPYVAYSYQTLYGINHFHDLYGSVQSMIETTADGKFQFKKGMFSDVNNLYNILDELSEYNDRFIKFKEYIKNIKDKYGKISPYLTEREVAAFRDMLINIRKEIDAYDFEWTMNTSGWFNNFKISRNIINRYNNKEGIHKLLNGEIPSEIKKEWEIYKKIENQREKEGLNKIGNYEELSLWIGTSESFSVGDYRFMYDGTNLLLDNTSLPDNKRMIPITKMSEKEVSDFFNNALIIQKNDIARRKNASNFKKVISKGNTYAVFLNIRNPLIHDYEGTHQGQGYKQSQKNSFGYVAARQVRKAIQEGNDGVVYENIYDPYLATNYGVLNPNQIKSATDNIEFSREDDNIYRGRDVIDAAADIKAKELFELQSEIDFYNKELERFKDSEYKREFINKRIKHYIDVVDKFKNKIRNTTTRTESAVEKILDEAKSYGDIIKPLYSVSYYTSDDSDGRIQYHPERISPVVNMQGIKKRAAQDLKSNITTLTRTVKNLEEKYKQVERKDLQTIIDENNITDTSIFQGTASLNKNSIAEDKKLEIAEKGVKFDSDYQAEVIKHLETDKISYTDLERKELVTLAKALFDYFNKNDFKIRIVTRPYSKQEAQVRSSAVSTVGRYATIYYVKQDNQESPFITLLHELLHIATSDAMPFDAEGRAIEDEQLQNYYSIFCSYVSRDPEYRKYSQQLMNAKSSDEYYAVPYKYRVLHHATESVGEFFSSFLNEKDVRNAVSSITYGEGRNLLEWLRDKIEEILSKIFKGYSHIQNTEVLKDITNFLLNYQYQGESNLRYADSEYNEYVTERNKENELEFNNALPYKDITATKASNVQTISEEFYTKQALYDYINDLVADGIKREDITVNYTPATEDTDDYWTVSYNQPTVQEPTIAEPLFKEESSTGYRERTIKNAKADATIALAVDFTSAGERLTRKAVTDNGKKYIPIDTNNPEITDELINSIVDQLNEVNAKSLNIAGNGIYTLKGKYTQEQVDEYVYNLLNKVLNHPNLKTKIETIRSGGQTGYDEAGIKAAMRLGIRNGILAPKGWKFRDVNGRDISDEQAFKARFNIQSQQTPQETTTEQPIDTHQEKETVDMTLDKQMKQVWNPTVLNSRIIRVTQIFKDIVTKLENQLDEREKLATSAATRQYLITTKYGAKNILNKVKEEIQNTYANKNWVENFVHELYDEEDWNTQEVNDKIDYIYQQGQYMIQFFEPLIKEASTEIKRLEKVSILTNDGELTQDDFEEDNTKAEEDLSKHEEGWFYENHEQSVESTLSSEVKTILTNLYEKDNEGFQTRFDDLEQPIPLDYRVALGTCLYVVGRCTSDNEMITSLREYSKKYPWLQDIVNILMGIDTETSKFYEELSDEDIELKAFNMRALFWRDMHKILVNIAEQSKDDNGNIITKILNKLEGADALDAEFEDNCYNNKTLFSNEGKPYKMVYRADGSFNKDNYDIIHQEILQSKLYQNIPTGKVSDAEINLIEKVLKSFGANISKEAITDLFTTGTKEQWSTLHSIIYGFYAAKQETNEPLQSVMGEEKANIYDAFRTQYDKLSTLFADKTEGRDESSVYVTVDGESKRLFSRIFPNRIHTLFNRLLNRDNLSERDYKSRLNEKYGHDWWYAAENPDGETPSFTGVLKDLWTSKKDRQKIKIKTLKASQGISYADEIDAQAEETRLNEFEATKSEGYADYSVPTFSDTGESYYATMKYFDIHNTEQRQELITRLTDVIRQEIRRINVVRERARINKEAIEAGLPKPIQPIACWDIDLDKGETSTDGTNFHFLPALNNNKETFLRRFNELSNNPDAQQQLLERAVVYAMNIEFNNYLNFYNQTQVNLLSDSKHTEKGNKNFIAFIDQIINERTVNNVPLNSTQLVYLNKVKKQLAEDTISIETFNQLKQSVKDILVSGLTPNERTNYIELSINNFQQDVTNLNKLEDYCWNYVYAQTQIINLTIKDPAFLGTADKVQKRYKMYYSPVQTAYTQEYDLKAFRETGELITIDEKLAKKTEYSLILSDDIIDHVYSFDNLKSLIDKKVEDGYLTKEQAVEILSNLSDTYAKTKGKRADINLADAQCYRTLPSWQKCLNMIGKGYNKKMQQSMNRLMNPKEYGDWSYEDFHNVWEIFKPFVASDMNSPSGIEDTFGNQYAEIGMPVMHKNAEFLLLAMYNQLSGVMKDNWKLKALNEFMVKHGIDKVQFESAVKLGSQGAININNCTTPEEVISTLEIATGLTGDTQASEGNKQVVHAIPFEDWGISTSMPEHLLDHPESSMGTQLMKIITEGLSENPNKTLKVGNRTMTYTQWLEEYQALQIANLMDDFAEVGKIFTNNGELVKYLKKQILTQNKYSHELLHHLELDDKGNFKYPLIDPMLRSQFDALCSSLIRNNVTKRKRRMGALPQVAAFGFEEDLQIRCTDRNGTLLRTKKEFEEQGSNIQGIETWEAYKEYCDHNATNIAYMEVYMSPFDTTLMRKINDACIYKENVYNESGKLIHRSGEFNHQLFNKIFAKDLLNGLANRVPTETKHSIIPIYVKGFLPAQNSSCVVVPAEWIAISDSDNDGDKLYCYFYHSKAVWNVSQMKRDWAKHYGWKYLSKSKREDMLMNPSKLTDDYKKSEELDAMWEAPSKFADKALEEFKKQAFTMYDKYCKIEPVEFKVKDIERIEGESDISYQHRCEMASIADNSFEARNNRMLDLERAVLQTDENSVQMLIPGGFPIIKKVVKDVIKPLYNAAKDTMSICNPATRTIQQIRNMAGANLIGIYANHRSFRPLLERAKCTLHANYRPTINGNESLPRENGNLTWSLSSSTNAKGEFISDNISNFSGASVDNAKDPLLSWLAQNTITASLSMFLIHCGYTLEEIALFMNQPSIKKAVRESFITGESLEKIVKRDYQELKKTSTGLSGETASQLLNSTMKDQIKRETEGILPTAEDNMIQMVVLENLMAIMPASRAIQNLINITKADTQVGALQAKSSENKSKLLLYDKIISEISSEDYPIIGAETLVPEINSVEDITTSEMPLTAAFRHLGVESIEGFTKDISMTFTKLVDKVLDVAMQHYNGLTLNAETVEALTHAATSYIFSDIAALNKGDRLKRFNMALAILREVKKTNLGKDNILIRDLLVNVNGNKYSKNMPFIKLKRLNNNYNATESYRRAWEDLIVNGDRTIQLKDRTITYQQLSNLLFNYCFMVSGLTRKGNSFINCFPPAYTDRIEGYNELLQRIPNMNITDGTANNIFEQYVANHPEDARFVHRINKDDFDIKGFLDKSKVVPDVIRIDDFTKATGWFDTKNIMGSEVRVPYDFITFTDNTGKRYLYKGYSNDIDGIYYQRVSVLGNSRNGYLEEYELGKTINLVNGVQSIIADNMNWFTSTNVKTEVEAKVQEANIQGRTLSTSEYKELYTRLLGDSSGIKITLNDYSASEEDATGMKFCAII